MKKRLKKFYEQFTEEQIETAKQVIRDKYGDKLKELGEKGEEKVMNILLPMLLTMYKNDKGEEYNEL